jgi:hypothetical protein
MAVGTTGFNFDPVALLRAYRARAAASLIDVLGKKAAFKTSNGKPIDREFMVQRAERLRANARIEILDTTGKPVKVSAASWRAGFVLSARLADIAESKIRSNGRWASVAGPMPYSVDTLEIFLRMTKKLVSMEQSRGVGPFGPTAGGQGGQFLSSSLLL